MGPRVFGFPGRYVQGPGSATQIPAILSDLRVRRPVLIADDVVAERVLPDLTPQIEQGGFATTQLRFPGECTHAAIEALRTQFRAANGDCAVAIGGGKTIDTTKGVAKAENVPLIVVPSIASNDSPTSRLIVLYDEAHKVVGVELMPRNPDAVVVDTNFIIRAPARFLVAGMGDALSKTFEVRQCAAAGGKNFFGTQPLSTAVMMADRAYELVREHGIAARDSVLRQQHSPAVEAVVEAAVLLSGLGFESGGLSLAHALNRGFTAIPALAAAIHGEMVAYGTLVQLCAEERPRAEIEDFARFSAALGLPVQISELGPAESTPDVLETVARLTCQAPYIGHFQRKLDERAIVNALRAAEEFGRQVAAH